MDKNNQTNDNHTENDFFNVSFERPVEKNFSDEIDSNDLPSNSSKWNDFYKRFKEEEIEKYGHNYENSDFILNNNITVENPLSEQTFYNPEKIQLNQKNKQKLFNTSLNKMQDVLKNIGVQDSSEYKDFKSRNIKNYESLQHPSFIDREKPDKVSQKSNSLNNEKISINPSLNKENSNEVDFPLHSITEKNKQATRNENIGTHNQQQSMYISDIDDLEFVKTDHSRRQSNDQHDSMSIDLDKIKDISFEDYSEIVENQEDAADSEKKQKKKEKKEAYSLKGFSISEKILFFFSVLLNVIKKLALFIIVVGILLGALAGGMGIGYFANLVRNTEPPSKEEMAQKIYQFDQQSTLYYAGGEPIANVRTDVVRSVTNLNQVSNYIVDGFIATEDEYFEEHPGIVPKAILRAVLETFITGSGTGGSTLTQQLVKQQLLSNEVTFFRKANEILLAIRLENYFSKEEILTAYLNVSPFGRNNNGDNVAGIGKASEGIFGVGPNEVSLNQAAFLVGLPQDPYSYTPYDQYGQIRENLEPGIERMKDVLYRMYRAKKIDKEEYDQAVAYDIRKDFLPPSRRTKDRQSYLYQAIMHGAILELMLLNIEDDGYTWQQVFSDVDWYNEYYFDTEDQLRTGGYKVYSTIDKEIYDQLQESAKAYEDEIGVTYDGVFTDPATGHETYFIEKVQTGLVAIDNPTGKVLGFVSGTDFEKNQIDHAFNMRRSPGSTIKPMAVYAPAIEENLINPATIIPDTAFVEEYDDGTTWEPTNYGNAVSGGLMTARRALLRSDNLPAVRIYDELLKRGVSIIDYLEKMGFNTIDSYTEEDTLNLAFSLGGVTTGPTVFEETRAFTTFANNGYYIDGYYIERIEDSFGNIVFQHNEPPVKVFSEDTNYLVVDMLRDTMTQGTGRTANEHMEITGDWIAKTGISENSKDIWVIASTPKITIGSWIGYDSKFYDYTIDVNDGFGLESVRSQIYWSRIVNDLYEIRPEIFGTELTFNQPNSVKEQSVLEQTGTLPGTTTFNGQSYTISQPLVKDLFKVAKPAPPLTGNFIFGATDDEQARFWQQFVSREQIQYQQQQQQQYLQQQQQNQQTVENTSVEETTLNEETTDPINQPETPVEDTQEIAPPPTE